jgi:hypothetical protein
MPRYYFVFCNDVRHDDPDGSDLPDLRAARSLAERSIRELKADAERSGHDYSRYRFIIEDEARRPVLIVPFAGEPPGRLTAD